MRQESVIEIQKSGEMGRALVVLQYHTLGGAVRRRMERYELHDPPRAGHEDIAQWERGVEH